MSPMQRILPAALVACLSATPPASAQFKPLNQKLVAINNPAPASTQLKTMNPKIVAFNGDVHVANAPCQSNEFPPNWQRKLSFVEAPEFVCAQWGHGATANARWELYKYGTANPWPGIKIGSGILPGNQLSGTDARFEIPLRSAGKSLLPQYNTTSADQHYRVVVQSFSSSGAASASSIDGELIHQPMPSAFSCPNSSGDHARKLTLSIFKMSVEQTSSTNGDGDRDELYFLARGLISGGGNVNRRLPLPDPGDDNDNYYEARNGVTYQPPFWRDKSHSVLYPTLWSGVLRHGQKIKLAVTAMEQDNADLANIKTGIVSAMGAVASAAAATGTPYGAVVAAVASAAAGISGALIPNTNGQDYVGMTYLEASNQCGYLQVAWTTTGTTKTSAGKVSSNFTDPDSLDSSPSRLSALGVQDAMQFQTPANFAPYTYRKTGDMFWWNANGTSDSRYRFLLVALASPAD